MYFKYWIAIGLFVCGEKEDEESHEWVFKKVSKKLNNSKGLKRRKLDMFLKEKTKYWKRIHKMIRMVWTKVFDSYSKKQKSRNGFGH